MSLPRILIEHGLEFYLLENQHFPVQAEIILKWAEVDIILQKFGICFPSSASPESVLP